MRQVVILGSGLPGSILATVLKRSGLDVLLLEEKSHPRFAIGESTVPQTSAMLRVLALKHDLPELLDLASYPGTLRISRTSGVKRNIGYVYHEEGRPAALERCLQSVLPDLPHGPDCHWYRPDVDHYMARTAVRYGVELREHTRVTAYEREDRAVRLELNGNETLRARFVVDCTGFRSLFARGEGLLPDDPGLATNTRSIFTHARDVPAFDRVLPVGSELPRMWCQGTVHHLFDGGWFWVIPFNNTDLAENSLCSVGLTLDCNRYPAQGLSAEEELRSFLARFPSVAEHLAGATPVRPWISTGRLQHRATRTVGDRFCLLGNAAGFVDPLYARAMGVTLEAVDVAAECIVDGFAAGDLGAERLAPLDALQQSGTRYTDELVSMSYRALRDFRLWNAAFRVWITGTTLGGMRIVRQLNKYDQTGDPSYLRVNPPELPYPGFLCPDLEEYYRVFAASKRLIERAADEPGTEDACFADVCRLIERGGFLPGAFQIGDPAARCPSEYRLRDYLRILRWGKKRAPEFIRRAYFDYGPSTFVRNVIRARHTKRLVRLTQPV
ncbi:MAG: NAD(P)/FAD-dependent oxidoreductase [Planctomycetota bacterium]